MIEQFRLTQSLIKIVVTGAASYWRKSSLLIYKDSPVRILGRRGGDCSIVTAPVGDTCRSVCCKRIGGRGGNRNVVV